VITVFAPNALPVKLPHQFSIFLAGSIENGSAYDWQNDIINKLIDIDGFIHNPRRLDWNWEWEQSIINPKFVEQVEWEMDTLNRSDFIFLHFEPNCKSPISLLELGLQAQSGKLCVHCPDGFWRKGNVDILCRKYNIKTVNTVDEFIDDIKNHANMINVLRSQAPIWKSHYPDSSIN
jgi:hypothetical protein